MGKIQAKRLFYVIIATYHTLIIWEYFLTDTSNQKASSAHRLSKKELRASLILPVIITLIIWGAGLLLYVVTPGEFNTAVALFISAALLAFLLYWTRHEEKRLRITAA